MLSLRLQLVQLQRHYVEELGDVIDATNVSRSEKNNNTDTMILDSMLEL